MEELRNNADTICISETIYDGQAEQGVELDYVLPDYYPEIFRILSCRLTPRIMSYGAAGDSKLTIDGNVDIKVLYLAEGSNNIHCIEQRYTYTKTIDIGKTTDKNICVQLDSRADYCNCRAVSGRRIDVRGAISTKIHITADRVTAIPVMPKELQVRTTELTCCSDIRSAEKQFTVREEIETGASGIRCIMRTCANAKVNEVRIIADKAVVKGIVTVNAAYGIYKDDMQGCADIERMTADIPVSQIIEISGIDENYSHTADIDILNCELTCNNENGIVGCNMLAVCRVRCCKETTICVPTDVYSTQYETEHNIRQIKAVKSTDSICKQFNLRSGVACESGEIEAVWDCCAEVFNTGCTPVEDGIRLSGQICYQVLCRNSEGIPCYIEKQESFEQIISADIKKADCIKEFSVVCADSDYTIRQDGTLDLTAAVEFCCNVTDDETVSIVEGVRVHEDKPKMRDNSYALRIFYADGTEDSWDIAKRYATSVDAIISENDIESTDEKLCGMILIPSV